MVDPDSRAIQKRLVEQWDNQLIEMERMQSVAEARPATGHEVFRSAGSSGDSVRFQIEPVVFNLPERANATSLDLFVVVGGRMSFSRREFNENSVLVTDAFASHIGYFRRRSQGLVHVFGAHYDFARDEVGHPVFHAQMKSFAQYSEVVREQFHNLGSGLVEDAVEGLLRTVRMPTAQMDVFSIFVQLCADHLLNKNSGAEEKRAFNSLLRRGVCYGADFQLAAQGAIGRQCYRSRHWYPAIT